MNMKLFDELMQHPPAQHPAEWLAFLELCEIYLHKWEIKRPIVVELGILHGKQRPFYEKLFNAKYIGIDITDKRAKPEILGDSGKQETFDKLRNKLKGRKVDIFYIDGCHTYEYTKHDFYTALLVTNGIIALNDVETGRKRRVKNHQVYKFWDELREESFDQGSLYATYLFYTIHQCRFVKKRDSRLGTGVMVMK